jgi:hypothetical protein
MYYNHAPYFLLTYLLTYVPHGIRSFLRSKGFAASKEIHCILWKPKVHCRIHKFPPPVSILSQPNPVHTPTSRFLKSILILFSHLHLGLPSGLFLKGSPLYTPWPWPIRATWPVHRILLLFYHPHSSGWGIQIMKFSPLPCYLVPKLLNSTRQFFPHYRCGNRRSYRIPFIHTQTHTHTHTHESKNV